MNGRVQDDEEERGVPRVSRRGTAGSEAADAKEVDAEEGPSEPGSDSSNSSDGESEDDAFGGHYFRDGYVEDYGNTKLAFSFREAANLLEDTRNAPITRLELSIRGRFDDRFGADSPREFRRFVSALGRGAEGKRIRAVRHIDFQRLGWDGLPSEDVERLCRDVLPHHPTLESINTKLPSPYVTILANSLRADSHRPLRKLTLQHGQDRAAVRAIADMVRRNVPLTELILRPEVGPELDGDACKIICQSVPHNTNLRTLYLKVKDVREDTLEGVAAASSPLRKLTVASNRFSDEGVESFALQLRTNTTLESLRLRNLSRSRFVRIRRFGKPPGPFDDRPFFGPIAAVVETYNVTLRRASLRWAALRSGTGNFEFPNQEHGEESRILAGYMRRNEWIRRAIEELEPRGYHVEPISALPHAVRRVSGLPTLVYRFLRRGYVSSMGDSRAPPPSGASTTQGTKKRKRRP